MTDTVNSRETIAVYLPDSEQIFTATTSASGFEYSLRHSAAPPDDPNYVTLSHSARPTHLQPNCHILVINSTKAGANGKFSATNFYENVIAPLLSHINATFSYLETSAPDSISRAAMEIRPERPTTVLFLSGDTSLSEFLNSLYSATSATSATPLYLGILPFGTGNALAASLGSATPLSGFWKFLGTAPQEFRLNEVTFPPHSVFVNSGGAVPDKILFSVVVSWCFHAALVADSDSPEYRLLGAERFRLAARDNLAKRQDYCGVLDYTKVEETEKMAENSISETSDGNLSASASDSATFTQLVHRVAHLSYFLVTPVSRLENTFVISPRAAPPAKGELRLITIQTTESGQLLSLMEAAYDGGRHVESPLVTYDRIDCGAAPLKLDVKETVAEKRRFCVDGTIVKSSEGIVEIRSFGSVIGNWNLWLIG